MKKDSPIIRKLYPKKGLISAEKLEKWLDRRLIEVSKVETNKTKLIAFGRQLGLRFGPAKNYTRDELYNIIEDKLLELYNSVQSTRTDLINKRPERKFLKRQEKQERIQRKMDKITIQKQLEREKEVKNAPPGRIVDVKVKEGFKDTVKDYHYKIENVLENPTKFIVDNKDVFISQLQEDLEHHKGIKFSLSIQVEYEKPTDGKVAYAWHKSQVHTLLPSSEDDITKFFIDSVLEVSNEMDIYTNKGSGWVFLDLGTVELKTIVYQPLKGSSYIELPQYLKTKRAIINVKNTNNECFKYAIISALYPIDRNPQRPTQYEKHFDKLNWEGLSFPLELKKVKKFEENNPNISVNVFGYENKVIYPLVLSTNETAKKMIDLMLITAPSEEEPISHYCWIKNLNALLHDQTNHIGKKYPCRRCLQIFSSQKILDIHKETCNSFKKQKVSLPKKGTKLVFNNKHKQLKTPFVIYADFESILKKTDVQLMDQKTGPYTVKREEHVPCSFCIKTVCIDKSLNSEPILYRGTNTEKVMKKFFKALKHESERIVKILNAPKPMNLTMEEELNYLNSEKCYICNEEYTDKNYKVRDHCHLTGNYRGAAHKTCNLTLRDKQKEVPVIFHNLRGYDSHLIIKAYEGGEDISCVPTNFEKMMAFTIKKANKIKLRFIDSFQFMGTSLERLVENLAKPSNELVKKRVVNLVDSLDEDDLEKLVDIIFKKGSENVQKELKDKSDFKNLLDFFNNLTDNDRDIISKACAKPDISNFINLQNNFQSNLDLLTQKGIYPYSYMDNFTRFNETSLPPKDAFFNDLSNESISEKDYQRAQEVWSKTGCKTLGDYHDIYLMVDVLLLADVFEEFRKMAFETYGLDPSHYFTAPGLSWDALLKQNNYEIDLLSDVNMYQFFEAGKRGGISMISKRFAKANNSKLKDYNPNLPSTYIQYLDANNLYGWAMTQYLPTRDFKWLNHEEIDILMETIEKIPEDSRRGYVIECDIEYPPELHVSHNDYPLCPEKLTVSNSQLSPKQMQMQEKLGLKEDKVAKLVPNLNNKTKYIVHYRYLQECLKQGLKLTKIHRGISFIQEPWMKPYIEFNTDKRKVAKNDFEKDFFKLMNNSAYGKTMEDVRSRVEVKFASNEKKVKKLAAKPTMKRFERYNSTLAAFEMSKVNILLDKPIFTGMVVLDESKRLMADFHYNFIKKKYGSKAKLLFTDTDSLCYEIETEDVYADFKEHLDKFDTSDYPKDHPLHSLINKKVVGVFKDEMSGKQIITFIGLRPKMYYVELEDGKSKGTAKGVKKHIIKKMNQKDYKNALFSEEKDFRSFKMLRSYKHSIYTIEMNKIGLSCYDTKRYITEDGINTISFGHYKLKQ